MPNWLFALDDFALIELVGVDRLEWLQGQATNDVRALQPGGRVSFCFCEPTGQILSIIDAWAFEDRILMSTARERVAAVLGRVESMTILEDVVAREMPLRGRWLSAAPAGNEGRLLLPSCRTLAGGWEVWAAEADLESGMSGFETGDPEPHRIAAGVPKWGADAGPRTLPPELGPAFEASHVSYAKGCYTGQEVLMRMHSRGHTNRTWAGLTAESPIEAGAPVLFGEKEVGRVSSAASSPLSNGLYVAAATLRNEATQVGSQVEAGGVRAEVRSMPMFQEA